MAQKKKTGGIMTIEGLDPSKPAEYISERQTPNCQNMEVETNVLRKRYGSTVMGASLSERVMAGKEFESAGVYYVVRIGLTTVQEWNAGTDTWDDVTGAALTATASDPVSIATPLLSGQRILTFTNYIDNPRKYTGTGNTADLGGSPPKCKYMVEFGSYLVLAYINDGTARPMRVQWCDTGDCEEWTDGNAGSKDLIEDGREITGMSLFASYVAVHKQQSIYLGYLVDSDAVISFDRKNVYGTICNNTIQNLPDGTQVYLSFDGIRIFNGISAPLIESGINDELRDSINPEYVHAAWSVVVQEKDEYWVAVPIGSQTTPDTIYKYNYRTGYCYKDTRSNVTCAFKFTATDALEWDDIDVSWDTYAGRWNDRALLDLFENVVLGDSSGWTTYRDITVNSDNTVAIDAYWQSKDYTSEEAGRLVRWQKLDMWAQGDNVTVSYSTDSGQTWTAIETTSLSDTYPEDDDPDELWFDVVSSKIRFRFRNNTAGETFYLKQFIISYREREIRG